MSHHKKEQKCIQGILKFNWIILHSFSTNLDDYFIWVIYSLPKFTIHHPWILSIVNCGDTLFQRHHYLELFVGQFRDHFVNELRWNRSALFFFVFFLVFISVFFNVPSFNLTTWFLHAGLIINMFIMGQGHWQYGSVVFVMWWSSLVWWIKNEI